MASQTRDEGSHSVDQGEQQFLMLPPHFRALTVAQVIRIRLYIATMQCDYLFYCVIK